MDYDRAPCSWPRRRGQAPLVTVQQAQVSGGHVYTHAPHHDTDGPAVMEQCTVHGPGHARSGGSCSGSYTDPMGPDGPPDRLIAVWRYGWESRTSFCGGCHDLPSVCQAAFRAWSDVADRRWRKLILYHELTAAFINTGARPRSRNDRTIRPRPRA